MAATVFRSPAAVYAADTCGPLRAAVNRGDLTMEALARGSYPGVRLSAGELPGVRSVGFWDASRHQDWGLDWHRNEGIEITWLQRGTLGFTGEAGKWTLQPGELTVTRPWQPHRVGAPTVAPGRLHWLILDVGVRRPNQRWRWPAWIEGATGPLDRLTELLRHNERPVWPGDDDVAGAFGRLGGAVERGDTRWAALHVCAVVLALAELLERRDPPLDATLSSSERTVALFLGTLAARAGEPWTLDRMAAECGLKRTRFAFYCERLTNMSPAEYLTWSRIERAAELLRTTDEPVTWIAHATGFSSSQYFATIFRRVRGCTPREHRLTA